MERRNPSLRSGQFWVVLGLAGGSAASGEIRESLSTGCGAGRRAILISVEAPVMGVERRGWVALIRSVINQKSCLGGVG